MEILFWQWHSFMGKGIERALHRLGVAYDTFFYQMNDWEKDDRFAEQLEKKIQQQDYDVVFSINFNPIISDVCQIINCLIVRGSMILRFISVIQRR